ncbi:hypothetical protein BC939DRAFT_528198 [Gamsiella multidivaricata]|uniref:uncharacterized protein n=1 Tax=Gamsiella multidivaricata TaxID=101098 RepID=UPI00221FB048|nr:uncharacterized protein BC939DRAFT_528198 [Gamsiella multidivaricata]KAG0358429.1 hypothetical protein BGZ54_010411 [Gamsiella multidivaricata]KAI7825155.1 hypothetical protein BC939DRAFT_528198 [Gamsiella multidivaricata]
MKFLALLSAVAISAVAAQSADDEGRLFYTEPTTATVWTAGNNHTVSWNNKCKSENTGDLNIVLYLGTGANGGTEQVRVPGIEAIGKLNCLKGNTATVVLPANLTTSDKYALHVDTEPLQSYSSPFTIKGIDPPAASSAAASTSAAATTTIVAPPTAPSSATPSPSKVADDKTSAAGSLKTLGAAAVVFAGAVSALLI